VISSQRFFPSPRASSARASSPRPLPGCAFGLLLLAACMLCACEESNDGSSKVNGSIHVLAGESPGAVETVNGNIDIDPDAAVTAAKTVNGAIRLGAHATADSLTTVNGGIRIDSAARVSGGADSVNGSITLGEAAQVGGSLENVNGAIDLSAAHVAGGIATVNGDIDVGARSRVERGILVKKADNAFIHFGQQVPRIVIGPGASVGGELRFEREVKLYVSDRATIGTVVGATAIRFSGDAPPG